MKRNVRVIGIGAGDPDYLTVQAINALNRTDVFFVPNKGAEKGKLAQFRRDICERFVREPRYRIVDYDTPERRRGEGAYPDSVEAWRAAVEAVYERLLREELREGEWGAFLVWGDPSLYDGTLRILDGIGSKGTVELEVEVVPGISSIQALAARHKVALNRIGEPILITTGRRLAEGFPEDVDSVVVMLDAGSAFSALDGDIEIRWGAYLGTDDEILVSGKLRDVGEEIGRRKLAAQAEHGWIMDTYLLARPGGGVDGGQ